METTSAAGAGVQPQTALYEQMLRKIIRDDLTGTASEPGLWISALGYDNIWRSSWALETLIDSIATLRSLDPNYQPPAWNGKSFIDYALENALNPSSGDWWDDFGWLGITCLRIVGLGLATPAQERILLRKAANSWCYIYGNGWKQGTSPDDWGKFAVPYTDAWNKHGISNNQGAPNVFTYIEQHPGKGSLDYRPLFSPGGIWNSTLNNDPFQKPVYDPVPPRCTILAPVQNTVTNGVYLVLTVRLYRALTDPAYTACFSDNPIAVETVKKAWTDQLDWFRNWLFDPEMKLDSNDRRLMRGSDKYAGLVRERVSTYANGNWDDSYYMGLAWTGDQGLVMGGLRESLKLLNDLKIPGDHDWLDAYLFILNGSRAAFYSDQGQPALGVQLRPWINYDDASGDPTFPSFPIGKDDPDYQTGIATFYRYLMQLQPEQPELAEPFRDIVYQTANTICATEFPKPSPHPDANYLCEGMVKQLEDPNDPGREAYNFLTPWINRIALLCMAIRFAKQ